MASKNEEFLRRLLVTFRGEAKEHLERISEGILALERTTGEEERAKIIENVFRETHSLKGAARTVNLSRIESLARSMEEVLAEAKRGTLVVGARTLDVLLRGVDTVGRLLVSEPGSERDRVGVGDEEVRHELAALSTNDGKPEGGQAQGQPLRGDDAEETRTERLAGRPAPGETVRITVERLEAILREAEALRATRRRVRTLTDDILAAEGELDRWKREWQRVRPVLRAVNNGIGRAEVSGTVSGPTLQRLVDFLDWNESFGNEFDATLRRLSRSALREGGALESATEVLLRESMRALMLPVSYLTDPLPAFIRRISREHGKEAELRLVGTDIELDRRVLQEIKDPIIHLLRNCVDHGLEQPEERTAAGKAGKGSITLSVARTDSGKVEIVISDDGRGIDAAKVSVSAAKLKLLPSAAVSTLSDAESLSLIFRSGVSTSPIVTDLSGRGLGLAIVREKVESIGGLVSVETAAGAGTTFRLVLPVTLSTFRGVTVACGDSLFLVPTLYVERVESVKPEEIKTVENRPVISLNGQAVALVSLRMMLGLPDVKEANRKCAAVVLNYGGQRIAIEVDEVLEEQEVLVKVLGPQLQRVRNIGGAAVMATGEIVPVLHVPDLVTSAAAASGVAERVVTAEQVSEGTQRQILVVEDSITARSLMKNILEGAGFRVATAVDGVQAFGELRQGEFDLVVSDVDMPRMNGFDLTARIRADKRLANLPVVLVTALESQRDRERGIDVGADAYIVKSSFEQSNLLEIIGRLV